MSKFPNEKEIASAISTVVGIIKAVCEDGFEVVINTKGEVTFKKGDDESEPMTNMAKVAKLLKLGHALNIAKNLPDRLQEKPVDVEKESVGDWVTNTGSEPDLPDDTKVEVVFRNGETDSGLLRQYYWDNDDDDDYGITKWRVVG